MALLANDAQIEISGHELLMQIILPPPLQGERTSYIRDISRAQTEWPLVETLVRLVINDGVVTTERVGVGGVANIPLRLANVEAALIGQPATDTTFENVAHRASEGAAPPPMTQSTVKLLCGTIYEALQRAASQV